MLNLIYITKLSKRKITIPEFEEWVWHTFFLTDITVCHEPKEFNALGHYKFLPHVVRAQPGPTCALGAAMVGVGPVFEGVINLVLVKLNFLPAA